jgi:hypothetical protein
MKRQVVYGQSHEASGGRFGCIVGSLDMTLEAATNWLIALHNWAGSYEDKEWRQIALDAIYMLLRAHHHLSRERIDEVKMRIGLEERLSKEKL